MAITEAQRNQVVQLVQDGAGCREAAGQAGISTGSVRKIIKDAGIEPGWTRPGAASKKAADPSAIRAKLSADLLADAALYRRLARKHASEGDVTRAKGMAICLGIVTDKLIALERPDPADDPAVRGLLLLLDEMDRRET
ncbi:MAG TPA: hypothetical protein VFV41_10580 [Streptosporangiaceae bacterium]|nr:hypothetical protein [Streptosporangiaceae bacterium]